MSSSPSGLSFPGRPGAHGRVAWLIRPPLAAVSLASRPGPGSHPVLLSVGLGTRPPCEGYGQQTSLSESVAVTPSAALFLHPRRREGHAWASHCTERKHLQGSFGQCLALLLRKVLGHGVPETKFMGSGQKGSRLPPPLSALWLFGRGCQPPSAPQRVTQKSWVV